MARDTSFYYSFLVLPAPRRDAIVAVWDFCRAVDDAVDEPGPSPKAALDEWRAEIERIFHGTPLTPQGTQLQPVVRAFHLPRPPFDDLVDGVQMDLDRSRYPTFEALYEYCWRVASTVGLVCVEIFGCRDPRSREYAMALGVALQLTNILRDVATDLGRGRIYLPLDDLARFGCTEADLAQPVANDAVRRLVAFECERARGYYAEAERLLPPPDARRLLPARIMAGIYREILVRIERAGHDVLASPIRVPRPRRAVIAATTWLRSLAGPGARA